MIFKKKNEEKELSDLIGGVISNESAVLACSINLMRAGNSAKKKSDPEMLLRVARAWYDLAKYLGSEEDEEDRKEPHFGFVALETVDDTGNEPDAG